MSPRRSTRLGVGAWLLVGSLLTARAPVAAQTAEPPAPPQTSLPASPQPPPQGAPPSKPGPVTARPPFLNRANAALPAWLRVRGELRERVEAANNTGFSDGRDDLYWLTRLRLDAAVRPARAFGIFLQAQDARVAKKSIGVRGTPFGGPLDMRLAFAEMGHATSRVGVRVGRQELSFGEQRLVGALNWTNTARSFDGVRATLRAPGLQIDAFEASVVRILPGEIDRSGSGSRLGGAYATINALVPGASVEPFVFWRRDVRQSAESGTPGDLSVATMGARLAGGLPARLDYDVEVVLQRGSIGSDAVRAWAGHWRVRHARPGAGAVRMATEYNFASGDDDARDGTRGTFDQLYPTGHEKYGLADQVGWRNVHHLRLGLDFAPIKALSVAASYHSWWLANRRDALYAANGAAIARVAAGAADRHVGQELDLQVTRALTPQVQFAAGYAHVFTGKFLKAATPGAAYSFPYVMATYVFLAEK